MTIASGSVALAAISGGAHEAEESSFAPFGFALTFDESIDLIRKYA
jgi:hypothetical protein